MSAKFVSSSISERLRSLTNIRKELVLAYVRKYRPSTIKELESRLSQEGIRSTEEDLLLIVQDLHMSGLISLDRARYDSLSGFLKAPAEAWWIYATIPVSALEVVLVVFQIQTMPLTFLRILFGLGLLGFLPGYSTLRFMFLADKFSQLERILLSIFLSVVVSISLGVILGAGYFFTGASSATVLMSYTVALTMLAAYRRYSLLRNSPKISRTPSSG